MPNLPARVAAALALACLFIAPAHADTLDEGVLAEINLARAHPAQYARLLRREADAQAQRFSSSDEAAIDEALDFLERQAPLPPLKADRRLAAAAYDHAADQGRRGGIGHVSTDGSGLGERLKSRSVWASLAAEDISYGFDAPRSVVTQLIVDSGVPGRGHRQNIFGRAYQVAGVSCGPHRTYGAMCVIDFAGGVVER